VVILVTTEILRRELALKNVTNSPQKSGDESGYRLKKVVTKWLRTTEANFWEVLKKWLQSGYVQFSFGISKITTKKPYKHSIL